MFVVNDDLSIYATRGDIVCLNVSAEDDSTGNPYEFQPGDIVRMKVFGKKDAETVYLSKDFPVVAKTNSVGVMLTEQDTKIGDVISKPTDYWYEIELNPYTNPQTIVGYDEDGAKIFKLFPEGKDIASEPVEPEVVAVVDADLDLTSSRPVENKAIARAVTLLKNDLETVDKRLTGKIKENRNASKALNEALLVERARIDNLLSGATAEGSEVVDIRVGADGVTYESAGTAVREQYKTVAARVDEIANAKGIEDHSVIPCKLSVFENISSNLFDKNAWRKDGYYMDESGTVYQSEAFFYSGLIPVESNTAYAINNARLVTYFDSDESPIGLGENISAYGDHPFTTPSGACYVRVSGRLADIDSIQLNKNKTLLPYEEPVYKMPSEYILKKHRADINIPANLYKVEGCPLDIYFENIVEDASKYKLAVECSKGIYYEDRLGSFDIATDTPISFALHDDEQEVLNKVSSVVRNVRATNGNGVTKKCMFIGDSTTAAGCYTRTLLDLFANDGMSIELMGTLGTAPNVHEGRSGWSTSEYFKSGLNGITNPFYNGSTFSFGHYMAQHGGSTPDCVFIHLGINDIYPFNSISEYENGVGGIIERFESIVQSIREYNASIKVCVMLPIPPNATQFAFGAQYGCSRQRWQYKANYNLFVQRLIDVFDNRDGENIFVVPVNTFMNPSTDIADAIHPKKDVPDVGYEKMAKPIYYFLKYLGGLG